MVTMVENNFVFVKDHSFKIQIKHLYKNFKNIR